MTTVLSIVTAAMKECGALGIGQSPLAEDTNDAFTRLNWMIAQWRRKRWLVYRLVNYSKTATGASSYSVGPGGDYDIPIRPDRLESAFNRQLTSNPNQVDTPLTLIQSREDYDRIAVKNLTSFPYAVWYDPDWPLGNLKPYPVPQASLYAVHITVKLVIEAFTGLAQDIELPEEYMAALHYNLAIRLGETFSLPPRPVTIGLAKDSLNVIRGANAAVSTLRMPSDLVRPGIYNPYSDQTR